MDSSYAMVCKKCKSYACFGAMKVGSFAIHRVDAENFLYSHLKCGEIDIVCLEAVPDDYEYEGAYLDAKE